MKLIVTDREGQTRDVPFKPGTSMMQVLEAADFGIRADCGGCCVCATCHVYIDENWLKQAGEAGGEEMDMLDDACEPEDNSRLSCQISLTEAHDGMEVTVAPEWD
ncbi:MAG: 2Fe-2S iron-sulfur cluster-binding protein [Thiolinea sp.]